MTTIPPERNHVDTPEPHQARDAAESFGADPDRYDRTRPRYPAEMVQAVAARSPGPDLLDVGAGTGIAARQFRQLGCRVLGVEVDERMAAFARKDELEVETAPFERWDSAGRTFDAVVSGQTWHWIAPVAGAAKAAEVLRPGGRIALFWNVFQLPAELVAAFGEAHRRLLTGPLATIFDKPDTEPYRPIFTKAVDGIEEAGGFGATEEWRYEWERPYTRDQWLDQLPTSGGYALVEPAVREQLERAIGEAIDAVGGSFRMQYTTVVITATKPAH